MPNNFYLNKLYPLQDQVLHLVRKIPSKFYLTGGTVVSRFITNHRFSDDLDFFLNMDNDFLPEANKIKTELIAIYGDGVEVTYNSDTFYRLLITADETVLKIDFVNDVGFHAGVFWENELYHKLDNPINILSNKICALQRNAGKDISDLLFLSFLYPFNWMQIVKDAQNKDTWVNEIDVMARIADFDIEDLKSVKWIKEPDYLFLKKCLQTIAKDILLGADNSLYGLVYEKRAFDTN
jgi:hypothetical protein